MRRGGRPHAAPTPAPAVSGVLRQFHGANFDKYLRYQMIALSFRGDVVSDEHRALLDAAMSRDADAARAILQ